MVKTMDEVIEYLKEKIEFFKDSNNSYWKGRVEAYECTLEFITESERNV